MSQLVNFQQEHLPKVQATMTSFLEQATNQPQLKESMLYSVNAGGKRIRPLLLLATVASFQDNVPTGAYQIAAALEMIHTYSLIHDDLPAMDDDDLRRGQPTNHKVFGEATAILAGDGLLTAAFELASLAEIDAPAKIQLIRLLAQASGTHGMVAGQAADMDAEGKHVDLSALMSIHQRKTGELIRFAMMAGGILAGQTADVVDDLSKMAQHLGLAFQIRDDLLDVVSTTEELGKEAHRDAALDKSTYPSLLGIAETKNMLLSEIQAAEDILKQLRTTMVQPELLDDVVALFHL